MKKPVGTLCALALVALGVGSGSGPVLMLGLMTFLVTWWE